MNTLCNGQWRLARHPVGPARESDFEWHEKPLSAPAPGHLLIRNLYLSIEPSNRAWMRREATCLPAQRLGSVMRGITVGVVEESENSDFPVGTQVMGMLGWQEYAVTDGTSDFLMHLPDRLDVPVTDYLGLLGHIGITAYFGLLEIGKIEKGNTLVVSSAAGAVGSIAGQIGKIHGCRVIGIAGSDDKCEWLTKELGIDAAINYKSEPVFKKLQRLCPRGIDVYFDNVGGAILEDVLNLINTRARVVISGMVSLYNDVCGSLAFPAGPNNLLNLVQKRARMEGFVCIDYFDRAGEATEALLGWHNAGKLRYQLNVIEGLRRAPVALNTLLDGSYHGKLVVKLS
jgi:NADPH-dependent curcumin reductase